ncbi:hypothetical protein BGW36DRAFT_378690 [Talaromyces proteolyticus]|uniref:C2H2-type domain-containing protein n=1 Tax=Talaromyces proteolyticus TaxID=1131652 RepID=A0AAD4KPE2_9EURO|nr:uncharacterized protein BGW36DRAFT_378690 [Talaromyces proteolyticus]KAH8697432.1 hypothetical protein BGW36DRAFT_378690 [Talaromyces proteolyticus]
MTNYNNNRPDLEWDDSNFPHHPIPADSVPRDRNNQSVGLTPQACVAIQQPTVPPFVPAYYMDPNRPYYAGASHHNALGPDSAAFIYPMNMENHSHHLVTGVQAPSPSVPTVKNGAMNINPLPEPAEPVHKSDNSNPDHNHRCDWQACNRSFTQPQDLKKHFKTDHHHSNNTVCEWGGCNSPFLQSKGLLRHVNTIHIFPDAFSCPINKCSKTFNRKDNIPRHVRLMHNRSPELDEVE